MIRRLAAVVAVACAGLAVTIWSAPAVEAQDAPVRPAALVAEGRALFLEACSSCHGDDGGGVPDLAPSLVGAGAQSADFYLSTGRMPLSHPEAQPMRNPPAYTPRARAALIAYVASLGGPPIPDVDPARGEINDGKELFTLHCSGCHQLVGRGGIVPPDGIAPPLQDATATQIAEAIRIGPYTMPPFGEEQLSRREVDSLARFVLYTREPWDRGGWGIGHIGPVPEGMVAWLLAGTALLIVIRLLGERSP